jgi:trimethylamine:corrinoid methyltransferase-like protein|tara:strand:- start:1999 stop:2226 length:228 start_codon:yes stop_codon:yes gene_type:complete
MADATITLTIPDAKTAAVLGALSRFYGVPATAAGAKQALAQAIRDVVASDERTEAAATAVTDKADAAWGDLREVR